MTEFLADTLWTGGATSILILLYFWFKRISLDKSMMSMGKKKIPIVPGGWPFIGHGLRVSTDLITFLKQCYEKHGGIFQFKIFMSNVVVICDRNLVREYLNQRDESFSFLEAVERLNFNWTIDEGRLVHGQVGADFINKIVTHKLQDMMVRVSGEMVNVTQRLELTCGDKGHTGEINDLMTQLILRATLSAIIPMEITDACLADMRALLKLTDGLVSASFVLPKWMLRCMFHWRIKQMRKVLVSHFKEEIQTYHDDPCKDHSILVRWSVDTLGAEGTPSDEEIVKVIIACLFSAAGSITQLLVNAITFVSLPQNTSLLQNLREECEECSNDMAKTLKAASAPLLHGCVLETARLTTQAIFNPKAPMSENSKIGDHYIGKDVDMVFLSPPMLHVHGDSAQLYSDPSEFNPHRFIGPNSEPQTAPSLLTWGGGRHPCPGRAYTIGAVKIALSEMIRNFDFKLDGNIPEFNYTTPTSFGERKIQAHVMKRKQLI